MEFLLNGRTHVLDAKTVVARVTAVPADPIRTHWVEIDGRRWPAKQAFRIALGTNAEPFISRYALRIFRRLGFNTSATPSEDTATPSRDPVAETVDADQTVTDGQALEAFGKLDRSSHPGLSPPGSPCSRLN